MIKDPYPLILSIHLISAMVFGTMAFINAFILQKTGLQQSKKIMNSLEMKQVIHKTMHISIGILILTGLYLLFFQLDSMTLESNHTLALSLKLVLALIVILFFFMMSGIIQNLRGKKDIDVQILNQFLFGSVVTVIVLAKLTLFI